MIAPYSGMAPVPTVKRIAFDDHATSLALVDIIV